MATQGQSTRGFGKLLVGLVIGLIVGLIGGVLIGPLLDGRSNVDFERPLNPVPRASTPGDARDERPGTIETPVEADPTMPADPAVEPDAPTEG